MEEGETPFATDKSKVDANEEQSWRHPQHQTDGDVRTIEEDKWCWCRVGFFPDLKWILLDQIFCLIFHH